MKDVLIRKAVIIHQGSAYHNMKMDVLVVDGKIDKIAEHIEGKFSDLIEGHELYCCIGLCDIGTKSGEPGHEHRETIHSLTKAALAGGYTCLAIFPDNNPITQTKANVRYLKDHPERNSVDLIPIGALSVDCKGEEITEYLDMMSEGVLTFSDGLSSISNSGLLARALQYAGQANGSIIHRPEDSYLSNHGQMHEGNMSTSMGLVGIPEIAESQMLHRDISLQKYAGGRLIEHCISSSEAVELIENVKTESKNIFATVAYLNLLKTDQDLHDFDTNLKVKPVLRSEQDRMSLINGIKTDILDAIVSNHVPLDTESKELEFTFARFGASGLETCLAACITNLKDQLGLEKIIYKMTTGPRLLLNLPIPNIEVGEDANLCVFDCGESHKIEKSLSKSINNPLINDKMSVKIKATIKY